MAKRIDELDFLKCIFILLMITFHLAYIGDTYPYLKQVVYTFHIPAFFIISGYVMHIDKPFSAFLRSVLWLIVPYIIMESGYVIMASVLPIREHINNLTFDVFINKLFVKPIGPYWYLHSLVICSIVYYLSFLGFKKQRNITSRIVVSSIVLGFLSVYCELISLSSVFYFFIGVSVKQSSVDFLSFFKSSWMAVIGFVILTVNPNNLDRFTIGGVLITYLSICSLLAIYKVLPHFISSFFNYIGRHTLVLLLFSPLFTILVKPLAGILSFDSSGLLFISLALIVTVCGCLLIGALTDYLGISRFIFGKERIIEPIK
ncbi:acyltransferase family protein [Bacteroides caecigallinarum]|nr:acyltransferase family protein [Bacteroides caecigallinarum]MBM6890480.1 acyltransferase family protein [Bacteroides caecigallinarum]MCF2553235.1 acyltransferase family protein [Bacteroides caecigallinarum]